MNYKQKPRPHLHDPNRSPNEDCYYNREPGTVWFSREENRQLRLTRARRKSGKWNLKKIDTQELEQRLMNALQRDIEHLLTASEAGKLNRDQASSLVQYLKLVKQIKESDEAEVDTLSNEELEKIAKGELK